MVSDAVAITTTGESPDLMSHEQLKQTLAARRRKEFKKNRKGGPDLPCGIFAAVVVGVITHPLDFLKTAAQLRVNGHTYRTPMKHDFASHWRCFRGVTAESFTHIMYGAKITAAARIFQVVIRNEFFRMSFKDRHMRSRKPKLPMQMFVGFICGAFEGITLVSAAETAKTLQIAESLSPKPFNHRPARWVPLMKQLYLEHPWSLFRAPLACSILQGYTTMIRFGLYASFKKSISGNARDAPLWQTFVVGGLTYTGSTILTMPFDVIKTQMQAIQTVEGVLNTNILHVAKNIGWTTQLFAGMVPKLIRCWTVGPLTFIVFEKTMNTFVNQ